MDIIQARSRSNSPAAGASSAAAPTQQNQTSSEHTSPEAQVAAQVIDPSTLTTTTPVVETQIAAGQDQKPTYAAVTSGRSSSSSSDRSRTPPPEAKSPSRLGKLLNKASDTLDSLGNRMSNALNGNTNKPAAQTPAQPQQTASLSADNPNAILSTQGAPHSPLATSKTGASNASSFITVTPRTQGTSSASSSDDTTVVETHGNTTTTTPATADSTSTSTTLNGTFIRGNPEAPNAAELGATQARLAQEQVEQAALEATSKQAHVDGDKTPNIEPAGQPSAQKNTIRFRNPLFDNTDDVDNTNNVDQASKTGTGPTTTAPQKVSCFKKHMKLIIISSIALVLAGLIAAPFIYDSEKTLSVLNNGLEATNSLIGKTGLSKLALGGIALGVIFAIALITLIALYIKGKNTMKEANKTLPAAETSFEMPELNKEMNLTINFNPNDLAETKAFEQQKDNLQKLIDKDVRTDGKSTIWTLIIDMGDIPSTNQNAFTIAQKIVDNIDINQYGYLNVIYFQFNDGYFSLSLSNKKLEILDTLVKSIPDSRKNDPCTRIVNITLSENKAQQSDFKTDTAAVKFYHGVNKVLNIVTCNKLNLETKVTI
jgi:hypothetical protein